MSAPPVELSLSLNTLSHIMTPDLARDLAHDLVTLLTHSRAHIRKRAVVAIFNACKEYPEILPAAFSRLRAMLEDPDPGVVVATVDVITELARNDPARYLNLAPQLFHILTTSSNNWILIKIMKLVSNISSYLNNVPLTRLLVCVLGPVGAPSSQEAASTHVRPDIDNKCNFAAVRMCAYLHHGRHAVGLFRALVGEGMCGQTVRISSE
jgi:hypothetical protein